MATETGTGVAAPLLADLVLGPLSHRHLDPTVTGVMTGATTGAIDWSLPRATRGRKIPRHRSRTSSLTALRSWPSGRSSTPSVWARRRRIRLALVLRQLLLRPQHPRLLRRLRRPQWLKPSLIPLRPKLFYRRALLRNSNRSSPRSRPSGWMLPPQHAH